MVLATLSEAVGVLFGMPTVLFLVIGLIAGIIFGVIPGIGPTLGMAVALPLTVPLSGVDAIILLVAIYNGAVYGGSIAAILINTPGTAASAATTFDGYPMARQGNAMKAISTSTASSFVGGTITAISLILLTPVMVIIVLAFTSPEYFLMTLLGISLITVVTRGSFVKGITAGMFGLALTTIGIAPMTPETRYTFGSPLLFDGLSFIAALIGIFAIAEMFKLASEHGTIAKTDFSIEGNRFSGIASVRTYWRHLLKSTVIGGAIGMIPGSGASVSNFIAYAEAMRSSKDHVFGEGDIRGVISSEAANNATVSGSLVPTLSFGIPGSGSTAVLLGGLLLHGLRPGPSLFADNITLVYTIFLSLILTALLLLVLGLTVVIWFGYITKVDTDYIIPLVIVLATVGSFALRINWIDVLTILVLGVIGLLMKRHDYSIVAFILGIVLGGIAEENLYRSFQISGGTFDIFFTRPLSLLFLVLIGLILLSPVRAHFSKTAED